MKNRSKYIVLFLGILTIGSLSLLGQKETSQSKQHLIANPLQDVTLKQSIENGAELYTDFCMQCHLPDGKGTPKVFPPLVQSDWLINKRKESIHAIKYGLKGPITVNGIEYNNAMNSLGLEDEEIADIMNYIMNSWGNTQTTMVTIKEVEAIKK